MPPVQSLLSHASAPQLELPTPGTAPVEIPPELQAERSRCDPSPTIEEEEDISVQEEGGLRSTRWILDFSSVRRRSERRRPWCLHRRSVMLIPPGGAPSSAPGHSARPSSASAPGVAWTAPT